MYDRHWTDDELISNLLGVGPEDGHLETCPDCARRWEKVRQKQEAVREAFTDVSPGKLTAQRHSIRARLYGKSHRLRPILASSLVTAILIVLVSLVLFKPESPRPPSPDTVLEDNLLEEAYQMSLSSEPTAIAPVQLLFEEEQ
jgi:anti-sigma factor RsiW